MHPRNPYSHLDFGTLAETFEPLKPHLKAVPSGTGYTIDFKNSKAQRRLTEALLYRDFKLHVVLSEDRLCPPVPNRLNYILWLQDILQAHDKYIDRYGNRDAGADVCGIDIGTGASAIYPLLGCHVEAGWKFVATELDETSFTYAKRNVEMNSLGNRIHLVKTTLNDPILLPLSLYPNMSFDFTMCNPPFYGSADEIKRSAAAKELPPNGVCTGAQVEMITPGGELGFISRILNESIQHSERCRWYTSMLGKLSSVIELVKLFRDNSIANYAITEFVQGSTRRWAIAWSFMDVHLPDSIARTSNPALRSYIPGRNTLQQTITTTTEWPNTLLLGVLSHIPGINVQQPSPGFLTIQATENTWSRSARRRAVAGIREHEGGGATLHSIFVCGIEIQGSQTLVFQWIQGRDRAMFESFVSHVARSCTAPFASKVLRDGMHQVPHLS